MSQNIPLKTSQAIRIFVRRFLEKRFPWAPSAEKNRGRANIREATRHLSEHPEGSPGFEKDRRLLLRLAYGKGISQLTEQSLERVTRLLGKADATVPGRMRRLLWSKEGKKVLAWLLRGVDQWNEASWSDNATSLELASLMRDPEQVDEDGGLALPYPIRQVAQAMPALREDHEVWKMLDQFESWALARGHGKWVIQASLRRLLGPLTASYRTAGIMRGWENMLSGERKRFISAGIEREKIALGDEPAHIRAAERHPSPASLRTRIETSRKERLSLQERLQSPSALQWTS